MGCECSKFSDVKPGTRAAAAPEPPKPADPNFDLGDDEDDQPTSLHDRFFPNKPEIDLPSIGGGDTM